MPPIARSHRLELGRTDVSESIGSDAAPTKQQAKHDGQAIEPPGKRELQGHADDGAQPDADAETCRSQNVFHLRQEWRVGCGDQQIDRGVIEATQNPLGRRDRPHIIGRRECEHRDEADDVDQDRRDVDPLHLDRHRDDRNGADEAQTDADRMHDAVGDDFSAFVMPANLPRTCVGCRLAWKVHTNRHDCCANFSGTSDFRPQSSRTSPANFSSRARSQFSDTLSLFVSLSVKLCIRCISGKNAATNASIFSFIFHPV